MTITQFASLGHTDVTVKNRALVYQGFIQVEQVSLRHRLFNQTTFIPTLSRELIRRRPAAGVLLYDDLQQKFALIEQFRVGAVDDPHSPWQLEVIAGVLDGDESPENCIRRESQEESGCEIGELQHLFSFYPSAGACNEIFHLYVAQVDLPAEGGIFGLADEGENIKLHLIPYAELAVLFQHKRLCNAPVIMALQWLQAHIAMQQQG